ncbi:MAG: biotin/lipoate A/B protein ligase family protein [Planktothrix sp.]|uniref:lipoate--protein ligase family protein n=1 Tax=Planktothrix sp. TaxID=3088171 RepID=UPI0038D3975D
MMTTYKLNSKSKLWRFIPVLNASGHLQMAIDHWLFQQHQQGKHPSTLRFYLWESPTLSLGYHQKHWPEHWQQLIWQNQSLELVRRPTGGRAVLHQGDLTYAVITSQLPENPRIAYQTLCQFLIEAWRSLGLELHYGTTGRGYIHNPNCFATATAADLILSDGTKLIGSAQLRGNGVILQHGSIRLTPDAELFRQVFGVEMPAPILTSIASPKALIPTVIDALMMAAQECFGGEWVVEPLSDTELETIEREYSGNWNVN